MVTIGFVGRNCLTLTALLVIKMLKTIEWRKHHYLMFKLILCCLKKGYYGWKQCHILLYLCSKSALNNISNKRVRITSQFIFCGPLKKCFFIPGCFTVYYYLRGSDIKVINQFNGLMYSNLPLNLTIILHIYNRIWFTRCFFHFLTQSTKTEKIFQYDSYFAFMFYVRPMFEYKSQYLT